MGAFHFLCFDLAFEPLEHFFCVFHSRANYIVSEDTFTSCIRGASHLRDIRHETFRFALSYCIEVVCASYLCFHVIRCYIFGVEETIINSFIRGTFFICSQSLAGIEPATIFMRSLSRPYTCGLARRVLLGCRLNQFGTIYPISVICTQLLSLRC